MTANRKPARPRPEKAPAVPTPGAIVASPEPVTTPGLLDKPGEQALSFLSETPAQADRYLRELGVKLLYAKLVWLGRAVPVFGPLGVLCVNNLLPPLLLYGWLGVLVILWAAGELLNFQAEPAKPTPHYCQQRRTLATVWVCCLGITWGSSAIAYSVLRAGGFELALLAYTVAVASIGVLVLTPVLSAAISYLLAVIVPLSIVFALQADAAHLLDCVLTAVILGLLVRIAIQEHNALTSALLLREDLARLRPLLNEAQTNEQTIRERLQFELKDRSAVETDLIQAKQAAEEAARVKTDFLATMSHEIRTPMNGVLGMAELLLNTELGKKQRRFAETIHRSGESLLNIINDILDFSKIEAGKLELHTVTFNLRQLTEDSVSLFAERADRKGLSLGCVYPADAHETYRGDRERMRQILTNLIGNAVKFTETGEVMLRVSVVQEVATGCRLRLEVSDTGIGIKPEAHAKIFDSFSQADGSTTRKYGGTGLGLAICKRLVHMMAGEIGVRSDFGKGSTFWVEVPLPKVQGVQARGSTVNRDTLSDLRILVVDDNPSGREVLSEQLGLWGASYSFTTCERAVKDLLEAADTAQRYDVVILDESSPTSPALKIAATIRSHEQFSALRLVLLVSTRNLEATAQLMMAGVDGYVDKPVRQAELFNCLVKVLGLVDQMASTRSGLAETSADIPIQLQGNVLVAEDNPVNQELVSRMLETLGCRVHVVNNGLEAVEALWKSPLDRLNDPYDAILMDCQMPEMDGFEATAKIRTKELSASAKKRLPIIALTANAMTGDRENCLAAGMDDYLSKPFSFAQLADVLRRWLKERPATEVNDIDDDETPSSGSAPSIAASSNRELINNTALDKIRALQREGQPDILAKVVGMFVDSSPKLVQGIEEAILIGDPEKLRNSAHSLKSAGANLGAESLAQQCAALEEMGRSRRMDHAFPLVEKLKVEYKCVCEALSKIVEKKAA